MKVKNPIKNIFFTIRATPYVTYKGKRISVTPIRTQQLEDFLLMYCSEFVFQSEKTITDDGNGNPHFQGRLRLNTKKRLTTFLNCFQEYFFENIQETGINPQAINGLATFQPEFHKSASEFYCLKDDHTSIKGSQVRFPVPEPPYDGSDLKFDDTLTYVKYTWQRELRAACTAIHERTVPFGSDMVRNGWARTVLVILDEEGGKGKSTFAKSMVFESPLDTVYLPVVDTAGQIMGALAKYERTLKTLMFDVPRDLATQDVRKVFMLAEQAKLGLFVTSYYASLATRLQAPPAVVIFSNRKFFNHEIRNWAPLNRYEFYKIEDGKLHPVVEFETWKPKEKPTKVAPEPEYLDGIY